MEAKDWRATTKDGMTKSYFHLRCYLEKSELNAKWWTKETKEIKKHRHILAKEYEKLVVRGI